MRAQASRVGLQWQGKVCPPLGPRRARKVHCTVASSPGSVCTQVRLACIRKDRQDRGQGWMPARRSRSAPPG